jgi:hypothetical protein
LRNSGKRVLFLLRRFVDLLARAAAHDGLALLER